VKVSFILAFARQHLTKLEAIVIIAAIVGAALTLAIGGLVRSDTIRMVDASSSLSSPYGELNSSSVVGYADNFSGWVPSSPNIQLTTTPNSLVFQGVFQNVPTWTSVVLLKNVNVNVTSYPILNADVNVTTGVRYGIRFFGQSFNGTQYSLWWEGSPLDHRPGIGPESLRVNMQREALLATGVSIQIINKMELYVEDPPNSPQSFRFTLIELSFEGYTLEMLSGNQYRVIYFDLKSIPQSNSSWNLEDISLGVTVQASPGSTFSIYLFNGLGIYASSTATVIAYNSLTSSSQYAFFPNVQLTVFSELLPESNESLAFVASTGTLQDISMNSVNFTFLPATATPSFSQQSLGLYYLYFIFFLFLLPVGIALLVFREFFSRKIVSKAGVLVVLVAGLLCRIALAVTTAHVFDTNVLLSSTRGWFQFRNLQGGPGPTLPLTYFLYWVSYSPYALLQLAGFQDAQLLGHAAGIVESAFVKLFPIIIDVLMYFLLFRFRPDGVGFVWAAFYYLNPLAIFTSSVWGQYDAATTAFIAGGVYLMSRQRYAHAALAFVVSGMVELVGFLPYTLLLLRTGRARLYKTLVTIVLALIPVFVYPPETDLLLRVFLSSVGFLHGQFSQAGSYTLLGSFPQLSIITQFRPLLISQMVIVAMASIDTYRNKMNTEKLVFYLCLSVVALLLFTSLLASWVWLVAICLLYAGMKGKSDLGAFMLILGTAVTFVEVSNTTGSAYLILGNLGYPILPFVEAIRNRLEIFTVMVTALTALVLFYLKYGSSDPRQTIVRTSAITLSLYLLLYFWLGVYPS